MSRLLCCERGAGLLSAVLGIGVALTMVLVAAHVLTYLMASSVVGAAAHDGARAVASVDGDVAAGEALAREVLGGLAASSTLDWSGSDTDTVVVTVRVDGPGLVPAGLAAPLGLDRIERSARAEREP